MTPTRGNVLFFLMHPSINLSPFWIFLPGTNKTTFLEKGDTAVEPHRAGSPLINIF